MLQNNKSIIQILGEIISKLEYQLYSGTLLYRFKHSIELPKEIFKDHLYYWIDEIGINPQTGKLEYTCSTIDSKYIRCIPVNTLSPEFLQIVHNRITQETSSTLTKK